MKKKICFISATSMSIKNFLINHLKKLSPDYEITIIAKMVPEEPLDDIEVKNVKILNLNISREINIVQDLKALLNLIKILRNEKFDSIHSVTPKAGLLSALAAKAAGVKNRIHTYTGQVWVNEKGIKRELLKFIDQIISSLNTDLLVDSESQRQFLISQGVLKNNKSSVLGKGSICGVDLDKFYRNSKLRKKLREEYKVDDNEIIFGFVGRLKKDKGILELIKAHDCSELENTKMLIIGPDEENLEGYLKKNSRIIYMGYKNNPEEYLNMVDIFCLPSHREGFGSVLIEAAAMEIPSVASNIYGVSDAVLDGETGFLHKKQDYQDLRKKMIYLASNEELRKKIGKNARERAEKEFSAEYSSSCWKEFYDKIFGEGEQ